jgi:hypothetical protein
MSKVKLLPGDLAVVAAPTLATNQLTKVERWLQWPKLGLVISSSQRIFVSNGVAWDYITIVIPNEGIYAVPHQKLSRIRSFDGQESPEIDPQDPTDPEPYTNP